MNWTPEQRDSAAREVVNRLPCHAELRQSTKDLVVQAWVGGEVSLGISNQLAIELCCERDQARRERDRSVEVLKMWERWERDREGDYSEIVNQSKVVIAALEAE